VSKCKQEDSTNNTTGHYFPTYIPPRPLSSMSPRPDTAYPNRANGSSPVIVRRRVNYIHVSTCALNRI